MKNAFAEFAILTYDLVEFKKNESLGIEPSPEHQLRKVILNMDDVKSFHETTLDYMDQECPAVSVVTEYHEYTLLISYQKFKTIFQKLLRINVNEKESILQ